MGNMILRRTKNCKIFLMGLHVGVIYDKIKYNNVGVYSYENQDFCLVVLRRAMCGGRGFRTW